MVKTASHGRKVTQKPTSKACMYVLFTQCVMIFRIHDVTF